MWRRIWRRNSTFELGDTDFADFSKFIEISGSYAGKETKCYKRFYFVWYILKQAMCSETVHFRTQMTSFCYKLCNGVFAGQIVANDYIRQTERHCTVFAGKWWQYARSIR